MESGEEEFKKSRVCALCDQNAPRGQWRMGRMVDVFPVQDGQVRVFQVSSRGK